MNDKIYVKFKESNEYDNYIPKEKYRNFLKRKSSCRNGEILSDSFYEILTDSAKYAYFSRNIHDMDLILIFNRKGFFPYTAQSIKECELYIDFKSRIIYNNKKQQTVFRATTISSKRIKNEIGIFKRILKEYNRINADIKELQERKRRFATEARIIFDNRKRYSL